MSILLSAAYSIIEPLGLLYLAGLAKKLGHHARIVLVRNFDFTPLFERVKEFKPDLVGFNVYTGAHTQVYPVLERLNQMGIRTVLGGPHATYFADDAARYAHHVVKGEGFSGFRRILEGSAPFGVLFEPELLKEGFPSPDREMFYREHPLHRDNPIKNSIAAVGCPYNCTYCYNSEYNELYGGFKLKSRPVEEVVAELEEVKRRWPTRMIYFQDDVFGFNISWLEAFAPLYRSRVNLPWHAQIRLELTRNPKRLALFREGGCFGITTAIESADPWIRAHVLDRDGMSNEEILEGCHRVNEAGLRLRTEQILAVPTGDLSTDLATLALNVRIQPDMAWSSIFAPYRGTALGELAVRWGYYEGTNEELKETFFARSVLSFFHNDRYQQDPTKPNPARRPFTPKENERYKDTAVALQALFNFFAYVPHGDRLAEEYLCLPASSFTRLAHIVRKIFGKFERHTLTGPFALARLARLTLKHCAVQGVNPERFATRAALRAAVRIRSERHRKLLDVAWPYFTLLPHGEALAQAFFSQDDLSLARLSTLTRHHLYDRVLYDTSHLATEHLRASA